MSYLPRPPTTLTSEESSWKERFTEGASPLMVFRLVSWGGEDTVSPHGRASCRQASASPLVLTSPGRGRVPGCVGGMPELASCRFLSFHTALSLRSHLPGTSTLIFWQSRSSCLLLCQKYLGKWWLRNRQWCWWHMPAIPALGKWRQGDQSSVITGDIASLIPENLSQKKIKKNKLKRW